MNYLLHGHDTEERIVLVLDEECNKATEHAEYVIQTIFLFNLSTMAFSNLDGINNNNISRSSKCH